jgi:polygalacturonase
MKRPTSLISRAVCALAISICSAAMGADVPITSTGAVGDGTTLNTTAIQAAINKVYSGGGGTVIVPTGKFLTGALFLKPKVNLMLESGGVLLGSTNINDYPSLVTRIEGHFQVWRPAIINASGCDGLRITGSGTLQGGGQPYWDAFRAARKAKKDTKNLDVDRPRNMFIEYSKNVVISGVQLRDSGFWNIHLYACHDVTVDGVDIRAGDKSPSTDAIDVDSCQNVTITHCYFQVNDDEIALKGSKGPLADQDKGSLPDEHIRISDCTFAHGGGVLTLGSEATTVKDVLVQNCKIVGPLGNHVLNVKLRPDTPQHYEDIHLENIVDDAPGSMITVAPWTQYFDLQGHPAPAQIAENISIVGVTGTTTSFGLISGPTQATVKNITLKNIDVTLSKPEPPKIEHVQNLTLDNVKINGTLLTAPGAAASPAAQ